MCIRDSYTLDHHTSFRANLRKRLWSRLGEQYHALRKQREAMHTSERGDGALDRARQWLYRDPEIHLKMDFEDGTYRRTEDGERMRRLGLSGAEARKRALRK